MNQLWFGDCLTVMRDHIARESVDLIYLDPPFNSQRQYNSIYKDETGRPLPDQVDAFCDMWELDAESERALTHMPVLLRENGVDDAAVELWRLWMNALRRVRPKLLAYLSYMVERLIYMKAILRPTGSIYLHCDPNASHYIKVMMDGSFGHSHFQNEIIWHYRRWTGKANRFQRLHDCLLFYTLSNNHLFNAQYDPYTEKSLKRKQNHHTRIKDGDVYVTSIDERGVRAGDVWYFPVINSQAKERIGYATQKPLALLERIIQASSNPGDVVFDPFCGCATTLEAAHNLGRPWVGIDIACHAIKRVTQVRLADRCGLQEGTDFVVSGVPKTTEGARDLWRRDTHHFQCWAIEQVEGFGTTKRTADGGIDGRLYFTVSDESNLQSMIIEVKGGKNVGIGVLRQLRGVLENEEAEMAGLIVLEPLSEIKERNFRRFAAEAGDMDVMGVKYERMQVLSVDEILARARFLTPSVVGRRELQPSLPLGGPGTARV